ncbi:hypothetical protein [Stigmatella hybrida]|uniref:hypothetical protein n=1 Tax=Stigmatella hybrida TaxID=394097 RepID=UPI001CDA7C3D|nr:hypothetical protein [Stigmatella hybrida]
MGRKKRENPPWSNAELALAECKRLLGKKRCTAVLRGLRRKVRLPRRLSETVALWKGLNALSPGIRDLKKSVKEAWVVASDDATPSPGRREGIKDSWEELEVSPVGSYAVRDLLKRLKPWLSQWDELLKEANRIRPKGEVAGTSEAETTAIARYLIKVSSEWERPITKKIAALLEVAHGLELPKDADARDSDWEKLLDKWKKALTRASRPSRPLAARSRRGAKRKGGTTSS